MKGKTMNNKTHDPMKPAKASADYDFHQLPIHTTSDLIVQSVAAQQHWALSGLEDNHPLEGNVIHAPFFQLVKFHLCIAESATQYLISAFPRSQRDRQVTHAISCYQVGAELLRDEEKIAA